MKGGARHALRFESDAEITTWLRASPLSQGATITSVQSRSIRGSAALVSMEDGSALFLKRCVQDRNIPSECREARVANAFGVHETLAAYRAVTPAILCYDSGAQVLATQGLPAFKSVEEAYLGQPPHDTALRAIAKQLAACHMASRNRRGRYDDLIQTVRESPVPVYDRVTPADIASAVGRDYLAFLASVQPANKSLRLLRDSWTDDTFIHGDFKADNVLLNSASIRYSDEVDVRFVDWELSGWGDWRWDVGSFVGQLLFYWIDSIPAAQIADPAAWEAHALVPFVEVRRAVATWLEAYGNASPVTSKTAGWRLHSVQYAGTFLLHRALATMEFTGGLTPQTYCCVHIGRTLLADPERGVSLFCGGASS